jgi:hypothetical protein
MDRDLSEVGARNSGDPDPGPPSPRATGASATSHHGAAPDAGPFVGSFRFGRGATARRNQRDGLARRELAIVDRLRGHGGPGYRGRGRDGEHRCRSNRCEYDLRLGGSGMRSRCRPVCPTRRRARGVLLGSKALQLHPGGDLNSRGGWLKGEIPLRDRECGRFPSLGPAPCRDCHHNRDREKKNGTHGASGESNADFFANIRRKGGAHSHRCNP